MKGLGKKVGNCISEDKHGHVVLYPKYSKWKLEYFLLCLWCHLWLERRHFKWIEHSVLVVKQAFIGLCSASLVQVWWGKISVFTF